MTISTLSVTRTGDTATMKVNRCKQVLVSARQQGRCYAAYQAQLEINIMLMQAINQTIGWVESTGGCEESIRLLREVRDEVQL